MRADDAQLAIGCVVGTSCKSLRTLTPALDLNQLDEAELDALADDLYDTMRTLAKCRRSLRHHQASLVLRRQDFDENHPDGI